MSTAVRAGILGTGFMGGVHAQAVRASGSQLVAIGGRTAESAARAASAYEGVVPVTSVAELVDLGIDVLHVCTPNASHYDYAAEAIAAGISVVCEKPLATSTAQAADLVRAAGAAGVATGVPFVYRFYPVVREMRRRIAQDGERLWMLHGSYLQDWLADRGQTNWRVDPAQGGASRAFGDIGVHWCDLMEFVTGQRIVRLSARVGNAFDRDGGAAQNQTEDGAVVSFETDQGGLGSVVLSQVSAGRSNRLWFSFDGPATSYSFDQETPNTGWIGRRDESRILERDPQRQTQLPVYPNTVPSGHPQGYQKAFDDFVSDAHAEVRGETRDGLPRFEDGLRAALLTEAVVASAASESWIDVPTVEGYLGALRPAS